MAFGPITSWQTDGKTMETERDFIFGVSKIIAAMVTAAMKLKDACSWKKSYDPPRQHIKKQRHYFASKGPSSQSYGFSSSHVWIWELDHKESWVLKNWCFWTVVLEKTLESPLDSKQHARLPCPSPSPRACSDSCPLSLWCHPTILSSVVPFSSCYQSFPASESFPMSQLFASAGQSIESSASASVLPMNIQDWFPLGLTGLILHSKGLSRVFSNTTVQKHQFFSTQLSLWSNSHIRTWLLENNSFDCMDLCWQSNVSAFQ